MYFFSPYCDPGSLSCADFSSAEEFSAHFVVGSELRFLPSFAIEIPNLDGYSSYRYSILVQRYWYRYLKYNRYRYIRYVASDVAAYVSHWILLNLVQPC